MRTGFIPTLALAVDPDDSAFVYAGTELGGVQRGRERVEAFDGAGPGPPKTSQHRAPYE